MSARNTHRTVTLAVNSIKHGKKIVKRSANTKDKKICTLIIGARRTKSIRNVYGKATTPISVISKVKQFENERMVTVKVFTKKWWIAAGIRALKTMAQTAIATIGVSVVMEDVNWLAVGSAALLAGILSLLTSLGGLPELED